MGRRVVRVARQRQIEETDGFGIVEVVGRIEGAAAKRRKRLIAIDSRAP